MPMSCLRNLTFSPIDLLLIILLVPMVRTITNSDRRQIPPKESIIFLSKSTLKESIQLPLLNTLLSSNN